VPSARAAVKVIVTILKSTFIHLPVKTWLSEFDGGLLGFVRRW
jgi:hypothetical protein